MSQTKFPVVDRFTHFHPDLAESLQLNKSPEFVQLLNETFEFLQSHELRPSNEKSQDPSTLATHTVYGGSVNTWFSLVSGKFKIDTCESVAKLHVLSSQLFRAKCPLFLVECRRPDLPVCPLYLDIDIAVKNNLESGSDLRTIEKLEHQLLGSENIHFSFLSYMVRILSSIYSVNEDEEIERFDLFVSSASSDKKISWRLVFPNIILNSERLGILRDYIVQKLNHLASRKEEKELNELKEWLLEISPTNMFRTIIDESAAKSRHGIRMVFHDKVSTTDGKLENRPFAPLVHLVAKIDEETKKIANLSLSEKTIGDLEWAQKNSLLWPSLIHRSITKWDRQPAVRSVASIRTGPGGSSLCLASMTVGDAIRAANRFQAVSRQNLENRKNNFSAIYKWEEGTLASFRNRLPIGIAGKFQEGEGKCTWRLQADSHSGSRSSIVFDQSNCVVTVISVDGDEFKYLTRMISRRFPNVHPVTPQVAVVQESGSKQNPEPIPEQKLFTVLKTYRGEEPGELDVDEGECVELVKHDASGWSAVKSVKSGQIGYVPATFIRAL